MRLTNAVNSFSPYERSTSILLSCATILAMLEEDEDFDASILHDRLLGTKNIKRTRKRVEDMMEELGIFAYKAYKSSLEQFLHLHAILSHTFRSNLGVPIRDAQMVSSQQNYDCLRLFDFSVGLLYTT